MLRSLHCHFLQHQLSQFAVQPKARPPTFRIFANASEKDIPEHYIRYLRNEMRAR